MKKLLLLSALLIFACSSDSEGNPCIYEPTLSTEAVTDITETSATLNGIIAIVSENCDVPNNAEQGFVYSTEIQPTLDDIQVNVNGTNISTTIEGLTPNTTYYVRSFLTNNLGDFYGNEIEFTTNEGSGLLNCDGNPVPTIVYGTQEWTVENACHITYRDGTPIPEVTDNVEWGSLTTGAWCYYDNDPTKPRLYNWYAVMGIYDEASLNNPSLRKEFAQEGWHIPSDNEWTTLAEYLIANGYNYDGSSYNCSPCDNGSTVNGPPTQIKIGKAMASTTGWIVSNSGPDYIGEIGNDQSTNNSSGFNAFPEGANSGNALSVEEGIIAVFWSSTFYGDVGLSADFAVGRKLANYDYDIDVYTSNVRQGQSVRLVKD